MLIVAVRETSGSALYGMLDVLLATGNVWQTLLRSGDERQYFRVRIVSPDGGLFTCGNRIPVNPDFAVSDDPAAPIVILPRALAGTGRDAGRPVPGPDRMDQASPRFGLDNLLRMLRRGSAGRDGAAGRLPGATRIFSGSAFPKYGSTRRPIWSTPTRPDGSPRPAGPRRGATWRSI